MNFENAIRGARNPMNSWGRMDSHTEPDGSFVFGPMILIWQCVLQRQVLTIENICVWFCQLDVTAHLLVEEYDTYKVATVANSTSTMHKIHSNHSQWMTSPAII